MTDSARSSRHLHDCLRALIAHPENIVTLSSAELDLVLRALRRVRLLGWLAEKLESDGSLPELPEAAVEQLTSAREVTRARARLATWELDRIAVAVRDRPGLGITALKGCAYLLRGLPNADGRLFADVDLMVAESDLEMLESLLLRHGWRTAELSPYDDRFYRAWSHELPAMVHAEREVEVDIHHNIRGRFARFRPEAGRLLADVRAIQGTGYESLGDADLVLHAMTHLFFGGDLADDLRDLLDIDVLLRYFAEQEPDFWGQLAERAAALNLNLPAFYGLRYASRLLGSPVADSTMMAVSRAAPAAPILWAMDRLVPLALFPMDPDRHARSARIARWLLFVRSHWVSMPPLRLMRHLSYKFYVRHLRSRIRRS